jgi:hypothetical protein
MANSASNLLGALPAQQLSGTIPLAQLPSAVVTNNDSANVTLSGTFSGNGAGLTNVNAVISGTLSGSQIYPSKWVTNAYTVSTNDTMLFCWGTNELLTLPTACLAGKMFTIISKNTYGSVIVTNGNGAQTIIIPGIGQGLAAYLGSATSENNTITVTFDGFNY